MTDPTPPRKPTAWPPRSGRRLARAVVRGGLIVVAVVAPVATFCHVSERAICRRCWSVRSVEVFGFGLFSRNSRLLPVWPRSEVVHPSATLAAAFDPSHEHDWDVYSRDRTGMFGYTGCGGYEVTLFAYRFECDRGFRSFALARVRTGDLGIGRLRQILGAAEDVGADAGKTAFFREGAALVREYDDRVRSGSGDPARSE